MPKNQEIIQSNSDKNNRTSRGFSGLNLIRDAIKSNLNDDEQPKQSSEPIKQNPPKIESKSNPIKTPVSRIPESPLRSGRATLAPSYIKPKSDEQQAPPKENVKKTVDISTKEFAARLYKECHLRMAVIAEDVKNSKTINPVPIIKIIPQFCKTIAISEFLFMHASKKKRIDSWIVSHSVNVAIVAAKIAQGLKFDMQKQYELALSAFLHDLGMIHVPSKILHKQGRLNEEEYTKIKQHPINSRAIVKHMESKFPFLVKAVYQEQERNDGTGYPLGIKGNEIHEYARIIAVADVFEALVHGRAYREGFLSYNAIRKLLEQKSKQFDATVVKGFIDVISMYPVGSMVQLNTLEIAEVISVNKHRPVRPVVKVVKDSEGNAINSEMIINLEQEPLIYITKPVDL